MENFVKLGISEVLSRELKNYNIKEPTKVQEEAIPLILNKEDVLVQSRTGSGKTISFAIPTIDNMEGEGITTLVITPTRELAKQVAGEFKKFSEYKNLNVVTVYGGVSISKQVNALKKAHIVVGTPGRLLDLTRRNALNLNKVKRFVLDEADRMLDMGFIDDIDKIITNMPKERQNLMFSATINGKIINIMEKYLNNPKQVILNNIIESKQLEQYYYNAPRGRKIPLLIHLIKKLKPESSIIFCNTKRQTRYISKALRMNKIHAKCMNGDMTQYKREKTLKKFRRDKVDVLVGTDVLARGLDVEGITHIFNYDLPYDAETYTHRIGRTARKNEKGTAIILLSSNDFQKMKGIKEKYGTKIKLKELNEDIPYVKLPEKKNRRNYKHSKFNNKNRRKRPRRRRN